jgi:2'-5' RNA ligase
MRLFVAVNLPDGERRAAHAAAAPLREAVRPVKWVSSEGLHVTLKFLGEVAPGRADAIGAALGAAVRGVRPFELALGGFGAFPDLQRPRVFWVGVDRHPALELLAHDVEKALAPFGFTSELRPFQPHVTIGRARQDAGASALAPAADAVAGLAYDGVMVVESVDLMESRHGRAGPEYAVLSRAVLGGGR